MDIYLRVEVEYVDGPEALEVVVADALADEVVWLNFKVNDTVCAVMGVTPLTPPALGHKCVLCERWV